MKLNLNIEKTKRIWGQVLDSCKFATKVVCEIDKHGQQYETRYLFQGCRNGIDATFNFHKNGTKIQKILVRYNLNGNPILEKTEYGYEEKTEWITIKCDFSKK
ncbi:MAG: hypothetical protein KJ879_00330 [Nanoarchaeota archaeon]|nr:hypothetical protein [Nanoarchaeota archaeon]